MRPIKKKISRKASKSAAREDYLSNQTEGTGYSDLYRKKEKKKISKAEAARANAKKAVINEIKGSGSRNATKKAARKVGRAERSLGVKKGEVLSRAINGRPR